MMKRRDTKQATEVKGATLIAENTSITGDIAFGDQLIVNGEIKGNVLAAEGSQATLTVSDRGSIEGQIRVPVVVINGRVTGDVYSEKHLELDAKAQIEGNLYYRVVEVVKGARVQGRLIHMDSGAEDGEEQGPRNVAPEALPTSARDEGGDAKPRRGDGASVKPIGVGAGKATG